MSANKMSINKGGKGLAKKTHNFSICFLFLN